MSTSNGDATVVQTKTTKKNFTLLPILSKDKLVAPNYKDWMQNLKMTLSYKVNDYVLKKPFLEINESTATLEDLATIKKHYDDATMVAFIIVATTLPELQKSDKEYLPYEMRLDLVERFQFFFQERYEVVKVFMACKLKEQKIRSFC